MPADVDPVATDLLPNLVGRYPETERGRCSSCGFLGHGTFVASDETDPGLGEIAGWGRKNGFVPAGYLACLREAANPQGEYKEALKTHVGAPDDTYDTIHQAAVEAVIHSDRHCLDWYPYQPGLTPKEHLDQMLEMQMMQMRHDHELRLAQMEQESRKATANAAEINQAIQTEIRDLQKDTKSFTTRWTYAAFGIAVAALLFAAAGDLVQLLVYLHTVSPPTP